MKREVKKCDGNDKGKKRGHNRRGRGNHNSCRGGSRPTEAVTRVHGRVQADDRKARLEHRDECVMRKGSPNTIREERCRMRLWVHQEKVVKSPNSTCWFCWIWCPSNQNWHSFAKGVCLRGWEDKVDVSGFLKVREKFNQGASEVCSWAEWIGVGWCELTTP